jgi:hypothetical protein
MSIEKFSSVKGEMFDVSSTENNSDSISEYSKSATTILYWNSEYQKPPMTVTESKIAISHHKNVSKVQLRNVSGGEYLLGRGIHIIEPGNYVLSLHGSTYPEAFIWASVYYN